MLRIIVALASLASAAAFAQSPRTPHPLDPLSRDEIHAAAALLRSTPEFPSGARFATIELREPDKARVLRWPDGGAIPREAFAVVLDRAANRTYEAVVDLGASRIETWREVKGVQPAVLPGEYELVPGIVKSDPRWQAAMRRRGITDFGRVQIDAWAAGELTSAQRSARLMRAISYVKDSTVNFYGRPIEGVIALVDMNAGKVVQLEDAGVVPVPPPGQELDEESIGTRAKPAPLVITQPNGPGFSLDGQEVRWQKWRFRFTMHPREGVVLQQVGYEDDGRVRPILYRASLSEMVVPYGDPGQAWRWRSAFDVGEYNVGRLASPIEPSTDAPDYATLLDATFAGDDGEPYVLPRAVAIYERDGGLLWKHFDFYTNRNDSRRARELVVSFVATVGNYDYALSWIFHQDGALDADVALTGIMLPQGSPLATMAGVGAHPAAGTLVAPHVVAPFHQHFFNFRLDFDVDGPTNAVAELDAGPMPAGAMNPSMNGIAAHETVLPTERTARRRMDPAAARAWVVSSTDARNALGQHTSYVLLPGTNALPYVASASPVRRRAGFVDYHFWATRYHADERYAAGAYPNESSGGAGLPRWSADDESLTAQDVVVWYTLGITHVPRPEEWPVMPATHTGFRLVPARFFDRNPALDVPRP